MLKIGVLVSGGGTNLQAVLDAMDNGIIKNAQVVTVVTNRLKAYALERVKGYSINTATIRPRDFDDQEAFTEALMCHLDLMEVDLIVLAGYLVILSDVFIKHYKNRIINVHPSLIPSFCGDGFYGLKVHKKVLERGVKLTGATVHFVNEVTDGGPIISQKAVEVLSDDTPESLQKRVMEAAEWILLPEAINKIANNKIQVVNSKVIEER